MNLKYNSKLLSSVNEDDYYVMIYHKTPVLYWDKKENIIRLQHNNWKTKATASAMNYALKDIGINKRVSLKRGDLFLEDERLPHFEFRIKYEELI